MKILTSNEKFQNVPMPLMLAGAPLLGLAFVIFLPLIGFVMVAWLAGDRLVHWIDRTLRNQPHTKRTRVRQTASR